MHSFKKRIFSVFMAVLFVANMMSMNVLGETSVTETHTLGFHNTGESNVTITFCTEQCNGDFGGEIVDPNRLTVSKGKTQFQEIILREKDGQTA